MEMQYWKEDRSIEGVKQLKHTLRQILKSQCLVYLLHKVTIKRTCEKWCLLRTIEKEKKMTRGGLLLRNVCLRWNKQFHVCLVHHGARCIPHRAGKLGGTRKKGSQALNGKDPLEF
jgi:hypothetical protein